LTKSSTSISVNRKLTPTVMCSQLCRVLIGFWEQFWVINFTSLAAMWRTLH